MPDYRARTKRDAIAVAEQVFQESGGTVPVNVKAIAEHHGLHVYSEPAPEDLSGALVVKNGVGVILVNAEHVQVRQRFSIAHELGHYLIHRAPNDTDLFFRDERSARGNNPLEVQANAFAAALLMPAREVRRLVGGKKVSPLVDTDWIEDLAKHEFEVSSEALMFRLQNLRLLAV